MNVFNRIIMILAVLGLIALVAYTMVMPLTVVNATQGVIATFGDSIFDTQFYYWFMGVGAALLLLLLIVFWLEVRPRARKTVRVQTKGEGYAYLGLQSVVESLEYRIDELAGVRKVAAHIASRGKDVDVLLDLDTSPSVNIPALTDQVIALSHDIVEGQLGLHIHGKVQVNIHYEPYPRGTMPPTKPLGEEGVVRPTMVESPAAEASKGRAPKVAGRPVAVGAKPEPAVAQPERQEYNYGLDVKPAPVEGAQPSDAQTGEAASAGTGNGKKS